VHLHRRGGPEAARRRPWRVHLLLGGGLFRRGGTAGLPREIGGRMIGGTDIICPVRSDIPIADVIFRTVRRYWPRYVFLNAEETGPFTPWAGAGLPRPSGREFFIYRDEEAARSWDEQGAVPENANTMLHVILPPERAPLPALAEVTLVCGELTGEME